jgi:large subunit ribosomal protein L4
MATAQTVDVIGAKGKKVGTFDLPAELFDVQTNVPLIHQVVVAQRAAARQGTHSVLGRGEVSGSGKKPHKQKGTGRARQGSIRMPQHRGGGIVHGPQPRDYSQRTPKKMIVAALLGALSDRARGQRLHVLEGLGIDTPSTKAAAEVLASIETGRNLLIVLERGDETGIKSLRNLRSVHALFADQLNAYDVIVSDDIVFTKSAIESFIASKLSTSASKEEVSA